ncbi:hypothetical protein [Sphingobium sp.]|uniref:hypothetical protein n=1 Tax=Sphingobium sp. TaxID=1912891 RepID=UPI003B3A9CB5
MMAIVIASTVIGGFGSFALRGMVDVARAPWWVHVHGVAFMVWTLLFVAQAVTGQGVTGQGGSRVLHRRMGWASAGLGAALLPLGMGTAVMAIRLDRVPEFFPHGIFMALNIMEVLAFGLLLTLAIQLRRRTDWHRRLMLCAMVAIIGPAFGRILPMPLLGPWGGLAVMLCQLLFVVPLFVHDMTTRRRVHGASIMGGTAILLENLLVPVLAAAPPIIALTTVVANS